ncbi:MAG: Sec-independent protein translocase protein TatB, partial [Rhodospirillaceae bacterium]|nr:Sec-independent protein translocase protein TatB [Rhodospirillaceae bacterium]
MLDVGWQELFLIAVITIIVVGPKEIPRVLRTVTLWIRKIKDMAREFQSSIDDIAREAELDDIKKQLAEAQDFDIEREIEQTIDPSGELSNTIHDMAEPVDEAKSLAEDTAKSGEQDEAEAGTK